jgi:hypothetical protein
LTFEKLKINFFTGHYVLLSSLALEDSGRRQNEGKTSKHNILKQGRTTIFKCEPQRDFY